MDTTRANEKLIEAHGTGLEPPGSVKDWQADRLASSLSKMEVMFSQAVALQQQQGSVSADVVLRVQNTMVDLRTIAGHDTQSLHAIRSYADRVLDSAAAYDFNKHPDQSVAAAALLARNEFVKSDYYGVSKEACSANPGLERLCERSRAIVAAGYIGEKDLESVKVAVTDLQSANAKAAGVFHELAVQASGLPLPSPQIETMSHFRPDPIRPTIVINEDTSAEVRKDRREPVVDTFSHELGHWLSRDKSTQMVEAGVEHLRAQGGPDSVTVDKFFPRGSVEPSAFQYGSSNGRGLLGQEMRLEVDGGNKHPTSWGIMVKEMQGDLMSVAAEHAEFGKAAALALAASIVTMRDRERLEVLAIDTAALRQGPVDVRTVRFGEEHHTSAAVREFASRIEAGDLDKVRTPAQFDQLMGESIVSALTTQYAAVRSAELHVHHIENGRVVPGPPPGIDIKDVLTAEMSANLRHSVGAPTVLITSEEAKRLGPDAQVAALDLPGKAPTGEAVRYHLATQAPDGLSMPSIPQGTTKIGGLEVDNRMARFATEFVSQGETFAKSLEHATAKTLGEKSAPGVSGPPGELGSQEQQSKQRAQEKVSAESTPKAVEMAM